MFFSIIYIWKIVPFLAGTATYLTILQSHYAVKCASNKHILRIKELAVSVGLCKAVSMERVAGRMAAESTKQFEVMGGVLSLIDQSLVNSDWEGCIHTKVSLPCSSFGLLIGILASTLGNMQPEWRLSNSELNGVCHVIKVSVDLTTPLSHEVI